MLDAFAFSYLNHCISYLATEEALEDLVNVKSNV